MKNEKDNREENKKMIYAFALPGWLGGIG